MEIKLKLPTDEGQARLYVNGPKYHSVLYCFDTYLRNKIKYEGKHELQKIRDELWTLLGEEGIDLYAD